MLRQGQNGRRGTPLPMSTPRRSGVAIAAQHRHAGPMKHRNRPRGGARNEQAELLSEVACDPPDACATHGRCWTHSTWDDEDA